MEETMKAFICSAILVLCSAHVFAQSCRTHQYRSSDPTNYCGGILGVFGAGTDVCNCSDQYNVNICLHAYLYGSTAQRKCLNDAENQYNFCEDNQIPYYDLYFTCGFNTNGSPVAYPVDNPNPTPPAYNPEVIYPPYTGALILPRMKQFDPGQSLARAETLNLRLNLR